MHACMSLRDCLLLLVFGGLQASSPFSCLTAAKGKQRKEPKILTSLVVVEVVVMLGMVLPLPWLMMRTYDCVVAAVSVVG